MGWHPGSRHNELMPSRPPADDVVHQLHAGVVYILENAGSELFKFPKERLGALQASLHPSALADAGFKLTSLPPPQAHRCAERQQPFECFLGHSLMLSGAAQCQLVAAA